MSLLVVLMYIFIMQSTVYEFKKMSIIRFSFETNKELMDININTFKGNEFTASLDQWVIMNATNANVII